MRERLQGVAVCLVGLGTIAAAFVTYDGRGYHRPTDAGVALSAVVEPTPARSSARPVGTHAAPTRPAEAHAPHARPAVPTRVGLPAISVDAPVVPVTVHAGALDIPPDPKTLGWWSGGARAGSAHGSVVIVGHVDDWKAGRGALYRLEAVPMGSTVSVTTARGDVRYRIVGRRVYDKHALPTSVFARDGAPRLVLITCGGAFDTTTHHYTDNVVVYGVPI